MNTEKLLLKVPTRLDTERLVIRNPRRQAIRSVVLWHAENRVPSGQRTWVKFCLKGTLNKLGFCYKLLIFSMYFPRFLNDSGRGVMSPLRLMMKDSRSTRPAHSLLAWPMNLL